MVAAAPLRGGARDGRMVAATPSAGAETGNRLVTAAPAERKETGRWLVAAAHLTARGGAAAAPLERRDAGGRSTGAAALGKRVGGDPLSAAAALEERGASGRSTAAPEGKDTAGRTVVATARRGGPICNKAQCSFSFLIQHNQVDGVVFTVARHDGKKHVCFSQKIFR